METKNKIILLTLVIFLIVNISTVSSSWYDWSRYEYEGYSFKIPEGFHFTYGPGSDDNEYLVDKAGGRYTDFGSNRISIYVSNESNNESNNLILKYNDSLSFYNYGNETRGVYKTDNGTLITIRIYCWHDRIYDDERLEKDINIIKNMFNSMRVE